CRSSCDDYIDLETDQFCSRILEPLNISNSKPAFNEDILSLNPAEIPQLLKEGVISGYGRSKSEITYLSRLQRLLRARRERPRGRRAAECDQQLPPSDGDCHTPLPCEVRKSTVPRHERAVLTARHPARRNGLRGFERTRHSARRMGIGNTDS